MKDRNKPEVPSSADDPDDALSAGLEAAYRKRDQVSCPAPGQSVLRSLSQVMPDMPSVMLREPNTGDREPVVHPNSVHVPTDDDRYELHGEIARGGMGAIIKGRDRDLGRDIAIKVLLDAHKDNPEVVQRFVEEAQIGGQLQHPGIAPVYELGQFADRRPYISMKLVKGKTLAALFADRQDPSEGRTHMLGIFKQVCQAMAYVHSRGVIHRDLKPANIMVGSFGEVQVMDWGLAKVLAEGGVHDEQKAKEVAPDVSIIRTRRTSGSDSGSALGSTPGSASGSNTIMGSVMGTPAYMAPEQALGEIDLLDERADVFALGAILCQLLTGKPPYVAETSAEITLMASHADLDEAYERLAESNADGDLITLTRSCLSVRRADRPRDAEAVAKEFERYLESVEIRLRKGEVARAEAEARAIGERKRRKLALVMVVMLVAGLGGTACFANIMREQRGVQKDLAAHNEQLATQKVAEANNARDAQRVAEAATEEERRLRGQLEQQLRRSKQLRLSATAESLRSVKPNLSMLLAREAIDMARANGDPIPQIATESLHATLADTSGRLLESIDIYGYASDLSPDGGLLASGTRSGMVIFSLVPNGERTLEESTLHPGHIVSGPTFSPDGRFLGAYLETEDGEFPLVVWDMRQRDIEASMRELPLDGPMIRRMAGYSHGGKYLVTQNDGYMIEFWELPLGAKPEPALVLDVSDAEHQYPEMAGFNSTGTLMGIHPKGEGQLWDIADIEQPKLVRKFTSNVDPEAWGSYPTFSPDGRYYLVHCFGVESGHRQLVWDLHADADLEPDPVLVMTGHTARVRATFSPDGETIVTRSRDGTAQAWSLTTRQLLGSMSAGRSALECQDLSPDGRFLALGSADSVVRIWDLESRNRNGSALPLRGHDNRVTWVQFSPDGSVLYSADISGGLRCWTIGEDGSFGEHSRKPVSATVRSSSNQRWLTTRTAAGRWMRWDLHSEFVQGEVVRVPDGQMINAISDDGRWALMNQRGDRMSNLLGDLNSGSQHKLEQAGVDLSWGFLSANGNRVVIRSVEGDRALIWDISRAGPAETPRELHFVRIMGMNLSADGRWFVTKHVDNQIRRWDLDSADPEETVQTFESHGADNFGNMVVSHDGRWVACCEVNKTVSLWDMQAANLDHPLLTIKEASWHFDFSADGRHFVTQAEETRGYFAKSLAIWDLEADDVAASRRVMTGPSYAHMTTRLSPDGRFLAACSDQGDSYVWDLDRPELDNYPLVLRSSDLGTQAYAAVVHSFSSDNRRIFGYDTSYGWGSGDGVVQQWFLDQDLLLERVADFTGRELTEKERSTYVTDAR